MRDRKGISVVLGLLCILVVTLLAACGGGDSSSSNSGSLKVANETSSGLAISAIQLSPDSADNWGPNQLEANQTIASGSSITFTDIAPGTYDMFVTLADGQGLQWDNFTVTAGQTTNTVVSSAYKAAGKTITNPDAPATNINFTYIPSSGNQGATKESPGTALKVSEQYVVEIIK